MIETQNTYNSGIKSVEAVASGAAARAITAEKNAAEAIKAAGEITFSAIYPIGSIYMSVNDINPTELFGGKWELLSKSETIPIYYMWERKEDDVDK